MTSDEFICGRLVMLAWGVAGNISFPACCCVMFCVRTAVEQNGDQDWLRVIEERMPACIVRPDTRNPDFINILTVVDSIYSGEKVDILTNGATFWTEAPGREQVAVVGQMRLYR